MGMLELAIMQKVENILFDWSGVISDNISALLKTINSMFDERGVAPISMEELKQNWKQPYLKFYQQYLPGITLEEEDALFKRHGIKHYKPELIKNMPELIVKLKENKKEMYIVSSDPAESLLELLDRNNIRNCFKEIHCELHNKIETVKTIIKNNRINLETCFIVGDTAHEIEVGKEMGIKTIGVTWGMYTEERFKEENYPDYLIERVKNLEELLLS